jgi:hypothetical protein
MPKPMTCIVNDTAHYIAYNGRTLRIREKQGAQRNFTMNTAILKKIVRWARSGEYVRSGGLYIR